MSFLVSHDINSAKSMKILKLASFELEASHRLRMTPIWLDCVLTSCFREKTQESGIQTENLLLLSLLGHVVIGKSNDIFKGTLF